MSEKSQYDADAVEEMDGGALDVDVTDDKGAVPICPGCMRPVDPLAYYCPRCGGASGQLTPYIPFVNIRYNYSIFGRMWKMVFYEKKSPVIKLLVLALIILLCPILLLGLPFVLFSRPKIDPDLLDDEDDYEGEEDDEGVMNDEVGTAGDEGVVQGDEAEGDDRGH